MNEYLVKGFTMDDERLKAVRNIGSDYFDELLKWIRDIFFNGIGLPRKPFNDDAELKRYLENKK